MKCFAQITIAALALGAVWIGASTHASAQASAGQQILKSYDQERADVREALRALFRQMNVSYSIAPNVQGVVTVELRNVTFETALQNVLREVDATYRIEGGVYEIIRRDVSDPAPLYNFPVAQVAQAELPATMTTDGRFLYILRGTELFKVDKETLRLVKTGSLNEIPLLPTKK